MAKIIGNTTATPSPIGNLSNLKTKNKNSLVDAINEAAESANGDFVSYSEAQNLTDEQKETARNNINAVDASRVVNLLTGNEQIPTAAALDGYINSWTQDYCVRYDADPHYLPEEYKARARNNIGAISQAELDEAIANADASGDFISYTETQDLTDEQKEIARNNIDATGIYVGSGDMPEGYDIQIDLNGDTYVMVNKITDETSNEIPNCLAVKNYVADNVTIIDDNNGNITLNTSSKKVTLTDDGNGNIKMEVM